MIRLIAIYGIIGGLIVAVPMVWLMVGFSPSTFEKGGYLYGYLSMLIALTTVFLGVRHYRDKVLGGAIKFWPALFIGLGISAVASILYAIGWEISIAWSGFDFGATYSKAMVDAARAKGASETELQTVIAEAQSFATSYKNPLYRFPMTFIEMFPVGVLISLISATILRNSKVLPARVHN
ncbi:MAG TPA: DUF4199 domain-containing protein [Steroidobacteraceae bacterium]|nr:DUF4199 domain-containing protein [Steroidobacteraceae bacterium]